MINKETFFTEHKDFPVNSLENITQISLVEFPKKMNTLKIHLETLNRGEIMFFAINIMESFAFIYKADELEEFCRQTADYAKENDEKGLNTALSKIDDIVVRFTDELKNLLTEIKK